jgi:hypothetical protein
MKKIMVVFTVVMGAMNASKAQMTDFRGFNWGFNMETISSGEKAALITKSGNDELQYKDKLGGADCDVVYIFNDNDKLESGIYIFSKKYTNPQLYLQDYAKFKTLLTQKYGKPTGDPESMNTANNDHILKHHYGQAIADGKLSIFTVWNTERSVIKITLITIDKHPSLQIHYTSRSLDELENKEDLKNALNKL